MDLHYSSRSVTGLILLVFALCSFVSCGGGSGTIQTPVRHPRGGFDFSIIQDDYAPLGTAAKYTLKTEDLETQTAVRIYAENAENLRGLYFLLSYDPAAFSPVSAEPSAQMVDFVKQAGDDSQWLTLVELREVGEVYYGQVMSRAEEQTGFNGSAPVAEVLFERRPYAEHAVSAPPMTEAAAVQANWNAESQTLSWYHNCPGDYNQDGLVTVTDLTPLGVHFNEEGPFPYESAASVIDGNQDGLITVNDITAIGQNFNSRIDGYEVFATDNPAEVPNHQASEVVEFDYVPFEMASGERLTTRLRFERQYLEIDPNLILWVRAKGDEQFGFPSMPQLPSLSMWQTTNVSSFATAPSGGTDSCLLDVGGLPAVSYRTTTPNQLVYQRALDPIGSQWGPEVVVDGGDDPGHFTSMQIVAGNPAIAYYDGAAGDLKYCRSIDANGTAWDTPVEVATTGQVGFDCHLLVANGNPAICYQDMTNYQIKYVRADNNIGSLWGSPVTVAANGAPLPPGTGTFISAALVGANPAVAYFDNNSGDLYFIRAGDVNGSTWGSYVTVNQAGADVGRYCSLFVVDGQPAIAYLSDGVLAYARASDTLGTAWGSEVIVDSSGFNASGDLGASLCVNNGRPAISYYSGPPAQDLMYVTAVDAAGTNWCAPRSLDGPDDVGQQSCLTNIGTNPAISYYDATNDDLKFQILVSANNQAPTAQLDVDQTDGKTGQNFEFDASASSDSDGTIVLYEWDWLDDGTYEESTGSTPSAVHSYDASGDYTPHVRVTDNGGASSTAFVAIHVVPNELPVADLQANPTWGNPPFTVNFDASGSYDPDGTIVNYEWDWDGDGQYDASTDNIPTWSWVYEEPGDWEAMVRVTDDSGDFGFDTVLLSGNRPPVADGTATPDHGTAPFTISLDSTGSYDDDGVINGVWWDINDDGTDEYHDTSTGVWQTSMIWNGAVKIRLRVQDDGGAVATKLLIVNVSGGWHISTLDFQGDVGWYNSLALINNKPGVSYFDYTNGTLKYVRAQDGNGYAWYQPQTLGPIVDTMSYACYGTSLTWVNGSRAGIVFSGLDPGQSDRDYILASNAEGNAWNPFQALTPNVGPKPFQMVIASNPAFCSYDGYSNLMFTRASDATGSSWNAPVTAASGTGYWSSSSCSMAIVQGTPAIAYCRANGSMDLMYVRCSDAAGADWLEPVVVDSVGNPGEDCALAVINGRPAIAYVATESGGGWEIRYKRASDQFGSVWPSGFVQVLLDGRQVAGLDVVNGNPAIGMSKCTGAELMYARSSDTNGNSWPSVVVIDNTDANLGHGSHQCDMIVINDKPAISYCHSVDSALKYAVWE